MDLNERTNNPVIRHGLLMVKKAAGKDDISNIVHDRKLLITNFPFDRRVSQQVNIKDFTAKIAVSYYNTVVYTFFARS